MHLTAIAPRVLHVCCLSFCITGVLYLEDTASADITSSLLQGSSAAYWGGAALCSDNSSLRISNSTIQGNSAQGGAGLACSTLVAETTLLQGNSAAKFGGGIAASQNCKVRTKMSAEGLPNVAGRSEATCD